MPTAVLSTPPTSNSLSTKERRRLVLSTRKLGAVLGASPVVAERDIIYPVSSASSSSSSSSSSASSSRSTTPDSIKKASRRQASIYSPAKQHFVFTSPAGANSVLSLALPQDGETAAVKTLAKKASTKFKPSATNRGSNEIPRPLILRLNAVPPPITVRTPTSPTPSSLSGMRTPTAQTPTPTGSPAITPTTPVFPSSAEIRRKRVAKLSRTLGEIIPPYLVSAPKRPQQVAASQTLPSRSSRVWTTGNQMWRGEWNRKDIRDVQKQLRSLKAR
ncbi:hypothetical protein BC835DRAFT_1271581 [Cytidiella melzeri]|nr:hypothetical protein BC835DRAFT_1271581 [Cytidiella melzeri]